MAVLFKTNGKVKDIKPNAGTKFGLEELQEYVGGYIEIVRIGTDRILVVNEEGRLKNLDYNENASQYLYRNEIYTTIVGDAVLCSTDQLS